MGETVGGRVGEAEVGIGVGEFVGFLDVFAKDKDAIMASRRRRRVTVVIIGQTMSYGRKIMASLR